MIEPPRFGIRQQAYFWLCEVPCQQRDGGVQALLRHNHQQHANLNQPAERVLEEEVLHPLFVSWIQIEKRKAPSLAEGLEGIATPQTGLFRRHTLTSISPVKDADGRAH